MPTLLVNPLLELSSKVSAIKSIVYSDNRPSWLIITDFKVIVLDGEFGAVSFTLDVTKSTNRVIKDTVYSLKSRSFILAMDGCEVATWSDSGAEVPLSRVQFNVDIKRLTLLDRYDVMGVYFSDSTLCMMNSNGSVKSTHIDIIANESRKEYKLIDIASDSSNVITLCSHKGKYFAESWLVDHKIRNSSDEIRYPTQSISIDIEATVANQDIHLAFHESHNSFSIISTPKATKSKAKSGKSAEQSTWSKYRKNGEQLFSRVIHHKVDACYQTESTMIFMNTNVVSLWDMRYGTCVRTFQLESSFVSLSCIERSSSNSHDASKIHIILNSHHARGANKLSLATVDLEERGHGSLLQNIGMMAQDVVHMIHVYDPNTATILDQLSEEMRIELSLAYERYIDQKKQLFDNKTARLYPSFNEETIQTFFSLFESSGKQIPLESKDWDVMIMLCEYGKVSLVSTSKSLIKQAYLIGRIDLLLTIVEYVADLSEHDAVRMMVLVGSIEQDILVNFILDNHMLTFKKSSAAVSKSNKKRKSESGKSIIDEVKLMDVLQLLCYLMLRRTSPFSTMLLTDSLCALPLAIGTLILRIFIHLIRYHYIDVSSSSAANCDEKGLNHACNWIEAILDSNFSGYAMQMMTDKNTRETIKATLESIEIVDDRSEELETLIGTWTHIMRNAGNQQIKIPLSNATHRVQRITF